MKGGKCAGMHLVVRQQDKEEHRQDQRKPLFGIDIISLPLAKKAYQDTCLHLPSVFDILTKTLGSVHRPCGRKQE
jgi:hypothetical protein